MMLLPRLGLTLLAAALAATLATPPALAAAAGSPAAPARTAAGASESGAPSLAELQRRAERGDSAAPAALCQALFEGHGGAFDAAAAAEWCRRAAGLGDAAATLRLGLLSLAGVGTEKDLDAAARLCAEAQSRNPAVAAGFCLAAVREDRQRRAGAAGQPPAEPATKPDAAAAAAELGAWRNRALHGDRTATAHLCGAYFAAPRDAFEPVEAAEWCRRAARAGDADAFRRLGLLRLWGVGIEKSTPQAEALCHQAQALDPTVSAGFCVAAVRQEHALQAAQMSPSDVAKTAAPRLAGAAASPVDTLGFDRVLASIHATPTGLRFSCRDIVRWARYETPEGLSIVSPATEAFGRSILDFADKDYAALDRAAADCAAAIAPYDPDGSTRQQLAEFRRMLPLIKARQREVHRDVAVSNTDVPRCVEALRRSWGDTQRLVAGGPGGAGDWSDTYHCTRTGSWKPQAGTR